MIFLIILADAVTWFESGPRGTRHAAVRIHLVPPRSSSRLRSQDLSRLREIVDDRKGTVDLFMQNSAGQIVTVGKRGKGPK